jgi:hypothetical protein
LSLLQIETLAGFTALTNWRRDATIELGCYDGRALEIARLAGTRYVGVDLDEIAVARLRARIDAEDLAGRAAAVVADALDVDAWIAEVRGTAPLVHLPFNFLGMFDSGDLATVVREQYYEAFGVGTLRHERAADWR